MGLSNVMKFTHLGALCVQFLIAFVFCACTLHTCMLFHMASTTTNLMTPCFGGKKVTSTGFVSIEIS